MIEKTTDKTPTEQPADVPAEQPPEYQSGPAVSDIELLHNQMHQARKGAGGKVGPPAKPVPAAKK